MFGERSKDKRGPSFLDGREGKSLLRIPKKRQALLMEPPNSNTPRMSLSRLLSANALRRPLVAGLER
ncbi:hypothetical protein E4U15_001126 [Claviceps sp. LM218 group G6]|nr:hypothetical protein E4U15_001126 [Claviceps sp. LM218 group G6]